MEALYDVTVAILAQGTHWALAAKQAFSKARALFQHNARFPKSKRALDVADGHISPNTPDLFRPPKLSGEEPA